MGKRNHSSHSHTEFIIMGFPGPLEHQVLLFVLFLFIYLVILMENVLLIMTIRLNYHLHTPMYFFLGSLSLLEILYVSVTIPKVLSNLLLGDKAISLWGCMLQLFFFLSLGSSECFLLAAMAYDRYLAICHPLQYSGLMNPRVCVVLILASWLSGFLASFPSVVMISKLNFCDSNTIGHFFCDISPILKLSCTDTSTVEILDFMAALSVFMPSLLVTGSSYICVFTTVAKIPSTAGKQKAFSTCASHLVVVSMFYATTIFMYVRPRAIGTFDLNKLVSVVYTVVSPLLNPIIYSLRNREVRETLRRALNNKATSSIFCIKV
ncbi:olfactory receptor 226-like [Alligator mississippiensis]|uniref:olfactory receptor 226-like n=1 Tax=Alligator mississippiensis TaxID=8496 RepID=UPI0028778A16|nr:olfactory receptor 226-like [Alligator mississippiensis]